MIREHLHTASYKLRESGGSWFLEAGGLQITPLEFSFLCDLFRCGLEAAAGWLGLNVQVPRLVRVNTFLYGGRFNITWDISENAQDHEVPPRVWDACKALRYSWQNDVLPEILNHILVLERPASERATILQRLAEARERGRRLYELHFRVTIPSWLAISELDEYCSRVFQDETGTLSARLLGGFPNKTIEIGDRLWRLSRKARRSERVIQILATNGWSGLEAALMTFEEGRLFFGGLRRFLDTYGHRTEGYGLASESWLEKPEAVIRTLQRYVQVSDLDSPTKRRRAIVAARKGARQLCRKHLAGVAEDEVPRFELLVKTAQDAAVLLEDHGFYIDARAICAMRSVFLLAGNFLTRRGALSCDDDVFMLTFEEICEAISADGSLSLREIIYTRRQEMIRFRGDRPPRQLGMSAPQPSGNSHFQECLMKFAGTPDKASIETGIVRGYGASPGTTRGTARVVENIDDASRVERGCIIVTRSASPAWSILFSIASGIITDEGGMLCHCAVLAREYGIPAVVGAREATICIPDGSIVELNGGTGEVRVIS